MTDEQKRELLEMAARAAGIEQGAERADCGISITLPDGRHGHLPRWNPLADDGDALRLAVELGIDVEWRADGRVAAYRHANANGCCFTAFESSRENRVENTRRAITRAAAEIGRQMGAVDTRKR